MLPIIQTWVAGAPWLEILTVLIDVSLKGAAICALATIATLLLRRSSAFVRNMVWVFALAGLVALPAFSLFSPVWNLPLVPELGGWGSSPYALEDKTLGPEAMVGPPHSLAAGAENPSAAANTAAGSFNMPALAWFLLAWLAGVCLYLCWLLITRAGLRGIVVDGRPVDDSWSGLLNALSADLNLTRKVKLLESDKVQAAITVGILKPKILLPVEIEEWPDNRRSLVLSHELAHIKRWDTLIEVLAVMATVVYWFNPLVWFAVKQLRIERERDCDDVVLRTGVKPSDYAELLMNIAADLGSSVRPAWRLSTISQGSNLKERLMCILNPKINRNRGSRKSAVIIGVVVMALILPLSTSGIWSSEAGEMPGKDKKSKSEELKAKQAQSDTEKKEAGLKEEQLKKAKMKETKKTQKASVEERWKKVLENGSSSAAVVVAKTIEKSGIKAGMKKYVKMKEDGEYYFKEGEFNLLGYVLLGSGKTKEAIGVFKLNVEAYPESWNTYDSLGEAYLAADDYENALKNYKYSVKLNPKHENGRDIIKKITAKMEKNA